MNHSNLITVAEYAKLKGVSRQTVHWYIKKGKVKAQRIGSIWLIQSNHQPEE